MNALLEEAMHMLLYVDAHMNERIAVAKKIAHAIGHPWPPYPNAVDDDDDDLVATSGPIHSSR